MKKILLVSAIAALTTAGAFAQQAPEKELEMVVKYKNEKETRIPVEKIADIAYFDAPKYMKAGYALACEYNPKGTYAEYSLILSNTPDGSLKNEDDFMMILKLSAALAEDETDIVIPAGEYRPGTGVGTWDVSSSGISMVYDNEAITSPIVEGVATVDMVGSNYRVTVQAKGFDGSPVNVVYEGPVEIEVGSDGYTPFPENVEVEFTKSGGRFWGNWFYPFSDDGSLEFYSGEFDNKGVQISGYHLTLLFYIPKVDSPETYKDLPAGTYNIDNTKDANSRYWLPYTLQQGESIWLEMLGGYQDIGSILRYVGKDGKRHMSLITGGTMTVTKDGEDCNIVFNLVTKEGKTVTATYKGASGIGNYCDNSGQYPRPFSNTGEDVALEFTPTTIGVYYDLKNDICADMKHVYLMIVDESQAKGDYLSLDFLTQSGEVEDGVYTISDKDFKSHTMFPGNYSFGGVVQFCWFGDLSQLDKEGYCDYMAPLMEGTMTVSTEAGGARKFVFDFKDDDGHKLTGSWTGSLVKGQVPSGVAPKGMREIKLNK